MLLLITRTPADPTADPIMELIEANHVETFGIFAARDIDNMTDGYITAALWADCIWTEADQHPSGESGGREHLDPTPELRAAYRLTCARFFMENRADLEDYAVACDNHTHDGYREGNGSPFEHAGHDLWLTAQGHGTGFWDRGLGELGDRLTAAAKAFEAFEPPHDQGDGTAGL